jgi:Mg2+ and Co2+ transporter CorA
MKMSENNASAVNDDMEVNVAAEEEQLRQLLHRVMEAPLDPLHKRLGETQVELKCTGDAMKDALADASTIINGAVCELTDRVDKLKTAGEQQLRIVQSLPQSLVGIDKRLAGVSEAQAMFGKQLESAGEKIAGQAQDIVTAVSAARDRLSLALRDESETHIALTREVIAQGHSSKEDLRALRGSMAAMRDAFEQALEKQQAEHREALAALEARIGALNYQQSTLLGNSVAETAKRITVVQRCVLATAAIAATGAIAVVAILLRV